MTIFVEITRQFLRELFLETCQSSIDADNSTRRNLLFWRVTPRDMQLSLDKRERVQTLMTQLKQYVSDKMTLSTLLLLLEATGLYQSTILRLQHSCITAMGNIANIGVIELAEPSPTAS